MECSMDVVKDSPADYQALWGGTREYIDYKCVFPHEFEDEPPRGAAEIRAVREWEVTPPEERENWPDIVRERWEQWHLKKAEALGFKITIEELYWETGSLLRERRMERWLDMMDRDPELSIEEVTRRLLLEHLKELAQQPGYFADCGEEKYVRILGEMGITKTE